MPASFSGNGESGLRRGRARRALEPALVTLGERARGGGVTGEARNRRREERHPRALYEDEEVGECEEEAAPGLGDGLVLPARWVAADAGDAESSSRRATESRRVSSGSRSQTRRRASAVPPTAVTTSAIVARSERCIYESENLFEFRALVYSSLLFLDLTLLGPRSPRGVRSARGWASGGRRAWP